MLQKGTLIWIEFLISIKVYMQIIFFLLIFKKLIKINAENIVLPSLLWFYCHILKKGNKATLQIICLDLSQFAFITVFEYFSA